eukprot:Clim_evm87s207 gene=Clim_evmTU87s207
MAAKTLMTTTSNAQWTRLNASLMSLFQQKSKMALSQNKDVMKDIELLNHAVAETFEDALSQERIRPPAISHMLLMLQSVRTGCDKEQIVNAMTSFIMPYLGFYTEDPSRFGSYESKLDVMQDRMAPIQSVEDLDML